MDEELRNKILTAIAVIVVLYLMMSGHITPFKVKTYHDWIDLEGYGITFIDKQSYQYNNDTAYARAWFMMLNDKRIPLNDFNGKKVGRVESHIEFDCANRRARDLKLIPYDLQGKAFNNVQAPLDWQNIAPDTRDDYFYKTVCEPYLKGSAAD